MLHSKRRWGLAEKPAPIAVGDTSSAAGRGCQDCEAPQKKFFYHAEGGSGDEGETHPPESGAERGEERSPADPAEVGAAGGVVSLPTVLSKPHQGACFFLPILV